MRAGQEETGKAKAEMGVLTIQRDVKKAGEEGDWKKRQETEEGGKDYH